MKSTNTYWLYKWYLVRKTDIYVPSIVLVMGTETIDEALYKLVSGEQPRW